MKAARHPVLQILNYVDQHVATGQQIKFRIRRDFNHTMDRKHTNLANFLYGSMLLTILYKPPLQPFDGNTGHIAMTGGPGDGDGDRAVIHIHSEYL